MIALESDALFAATAKEALAALGITNVAIVEGPLTAGAPRQAPYDVIVFDGSIDEIPAGIIDQEARRLTYLVENVLNFSRTEKGQNRVAPAPSRLRLAERRVESVRHGHHL